MPMETLPPSQSSSLKPLLSQGKTLMLFDLSIRGHHPSYIRHLIHYWQIQQLIGQLIVVVSPEFLQEHGEVVALAAQEPKSTVKFVAIQEAEAAALRSRKSALNRMIRALQEWQLLAAYAARLGANHCLVMYFDTYQLPLAVQMPVPCPVSSIYFRPTFHYPTFTHAAPGWKAQLQQWREKLVIRQVMRHRQLDTLFSLDPFVVPHLHQLSHRAQAIHLPDPVEVAAPVTTGQVEALRQHLGIDAGRQVLLLFGALTERKGVFPLLEALAELPSGCCQQICLLLVGESKVAAQIDAQLARLRQIQPLQAIAHYQFVPEAAVQVYFHLADLVLAPYQRHVGMSGILLQAAAAQKPVLSSDYGLMGEMVRRYSLGLAVDSTRPAAIAEGICQFLRSAPATVGDRDRMQTLAEENSAHRFAQVVFEHLYP